MFPKKTRQGEQIEFTKMHGIGNDYVYIDCTRRTPDNLPALAREMSRRHTGIGSDGIILILPSEVADFRMRIFNADGSEARMCGNGSRCVARFVIDKGMSAEGDSLTLETLAGIKHLTARRNTAGDIEAVTVDMGLPTFECREIGMATDHSSMIEQLTTAGDFRFTAVGMGNPHGVVFLSPSEFEALDIESAGPRLENDPIWTDRANIEFAVVDSDNARIRLRVWERGSGETMACGTGACATLTAAIATGRLEQRSATMELPGGELHIEWRKEDGHVMMTGPAEFVFEGVYTRQNHTSDV